MNFNYAKRYLAGTENPWKAQPFPLTAVDQDQPLTIPLVIFMKGQSNMPGGDKL